MVGCINPSLPHLVMSNSSVGSSRYISHFVLNTDPTVLGPLSLLESPAIFGMQVINPRHHQHLSEITLLGAHHSLGFNLKSYKQ